MSKKTVAQKLFIKANNEILIVNEPEGYRQVLGELPSNVSVLTTPGLQVDLIQVFVTTREVLEEQLPRLKSLLKPKGPLWITYPKGTSRMARESRVRINRDVIWKIAEPFGLRPVAMISVDDTWSAMRLKVV